MILYYNILGNPLEREGHDRSDINLPGSQLQLLQDVANSASGEHVVIYILNHFEIRSQFLYSNCPCTVQCWSS